MIVYVGDDAHEQGVGYNTILSVSMILTRSSSKYCAHPSQEISVRNGNIVV